MKQSCVATATDPAAPAVPYSRLRRHLRISLDLPGVYSLPTRGWRRWILALFHPAGANSVRAHNHTPCRVLNLGLGGARLELGPSTALNDGQSLLLGITLADGTLLETIEAEVLEVPEQAAHATSVRVLFHPMDPHIQVQLGRLIHEFKISGGSDDSDPEEP